MRASTIRIAIGIMFGILGAACSTAPPAQPPHLLPQLPRRNRSNGAADRGADRTVLPIAEPNYPKETQLDARNAKAPPRFEVKPPQGAPNVIVFLIDDIGFGHPATYGGGIPMPTLDRLANSGLRYNRFHTTALCSPTRVAILTGRNHHSNNAGAIMEVATAFPGNTGARPQSITPLAEILRQNGYSTERVRQVSRDGAVGSQRLGPVRSLADAFGLRQVLRLHRRRDQPVGAARSRRHRQGRSRDDARLSLHHRHDQPGDPVDSHPAVADAGQAVLQLLRHRRDARAASRAEGLDREVQGPVRCRLGRLSPADLRAAEEAGHHSRRTRSLPTGPPTSRRGTRCPPTRSGCSRGRWKCSRRSPRTPITRSAASCRRSRTSASSTTR